MRSRIRVRAIRLAVLGLVALHAGVLAQRIRDLSITEPLVLGRWIAAAIMAAVGLVLLQRRVSRRAWGVFWTAVLLLHAAAPIQIVRGDVVLEAVLVLAPLALIAVAVVPARTGDPSWPLAQTAIAFRTELAYAPRASRAPPSR